jgi:hypothetical protein
MKSSIVRRIHVVKYQEIWEMELQQVFQEKIGIFTKTRRAVSIQTIESRRDEWKRSVRFIGVVLREISKMDSERLPKVRFRIDRGR